MRVTRDKRVWRHTCKRAFHHGGIARHVKMHEEARQDCVVTYTHGNTLRWNFSKQHTTTTER